jgi:hypothetical protein
VGRISKADMPTKAELKELIAQLRSQSAREEALSALTSGNVNKTMSILLQNGLL